MTPIRLSDLDVGRAARFYASSLDTEALNLLRSLGLTAQSIVRICKRGEPCIVQVRSTRIGLSATVAGAILVVPQPNGAI